MTRIGRTSGIPEYGKGFHGNIRISKELIENIKLTQEVAAKTRLHQFESTDSTFSKEAYGPFEEINTWMFG